MVVVQQTQKTEFGVLPANWNLASVSNLVSRNVIAPPMDGNHGEIHPKKSDFVSDGIPFVMASDLVAGHVDYNSCNFITEEQAKSLRKGFAQVGDILISHKATIGEVGLIKKNRFPFLMLTPQVTYYRVLDASELSPLFLFHFMRGELFQQKMREQSGGGTRAYIGITSQYSLPLIIPPIKEQEAIAEALSDADALITSLEKLIKKKSQIFEGLFNQLLSEQQNPLIELAPWQEYHFNDAYHFLPTATNSRGDLEHSGIGKLYIHYGDIHSKFRMHLDCNCENIPSIRPALKITASEIKVGDLVMADASEDLAGIGKATEITKLHDKKAVISGLHTYLLRPKLQIFAPRFQGYFFNSNAIKSKYLKVYTGMKVYGVSKAALKQISFEIPSIESQKKIIEILDPFSQDIECLKLQLLKAKKIKAGMMQELLTGRTRLI